MKENAIVNGFVNKPIYLYINKYNQTEDHMSRKTCPYIKKMNNIYWDDDDSYTGYLYLKDFLADPIAKDFNVTADSIRYGLYSYMQEFCDSIAAERFWGLWDGMTWTEQNDRDIHMVLKTALVGAYRGLIGQLWVT